MMRKLYLASFDITTGELRFQTNRLVVVTHEDENVLQGKFPGWEKAPDLDLKKDWGLDSAYVKAVQWAKRNFPESEINSVVVYPALDGDITDANFELDAPSHVKIKPELYERLSQSVSKEASIILGVDEIQEILKAV